MSTSALNTEPVAEHAPPQTAGYLLGRFGLLLMMAGLLLAAWNGQVVIVIVLGLVLSAAGLAKLWSRLSLVGVRCERLLNENRVFPAGLAQAAGRYPGTALRHP